MSIINDPIHNSAAPVLSSRFGFPVREDVALTNAKGENKPAIEKDFQKLMAAVSAPLTRVLEAGETVFWASRAMPPIHAFEQLTLGWAMYRYYNVGLVFTDRRLIIFGLTSSGVWRGTIKHVRWDRMTKLKAGGFFTQALSFKVGKKPFNYTRLGARNAKKIKTLLPFLTAANPAGAMADPLASGVESLCPRCVRPPAPRVYTCPNCAMTFKDERTLALRALIPGGAYFYIGWTGIGILTGLFECIILLALVGTLADPTGSKGQDAAPLGFMVGYYLFLIALEKGLGYLHARRFIREFEPIKVADANTPAATAQ